jgi:hypothetical protein
MELKNIPFYKLEINDEQDGVQFVALVDKPAIEKNWVKFNENKSLFKLASVDKQVVTGALLIADMPIYRRDNVLGEYYAVFNAETIEQIVQKFFKQGFNRNVNLMHDSQAQVDGVFMFESFIINREFGIAPPKGFEEIADGSWMGSFKVENKTVWDEFVKTGLLQGFSIEGLFKMNEYTPEEALAMAITDIINSISDC